MSINQNNFTLYSNTLNKVLSDPNQVNDLEFQRLQETSDYLEEQSKPDADVFDKYSYAKRLDYENSEVRKSSEDEELYGFIPGDILPKWVKKGYNDSITGLADQIYNGKQRFDLGDYGEKDLPFLEDIGATLISFIQPLDFAAMAAGGGVASAPARMATKSAIMKSIAKSGLKKKANTKVVEALMKTEANRAANLLMQNGVKRNLAEKAVKKAMPRVLHQARDIALGGAGGLGFYSGLQTAMGQQANEGDFEVALALKEAAKGAFLGSVTAPTGVLLKGAMKPTTTALGKIAQETAAKAIETTTFGTASPLLSGETPKLKDYAHAAGVIGGLTAQKKALKYAKKGFRTLTKQRELEGTTVTAEELAKQMRKGIESKSIFTNKKGEAFRKVRFDNRKETVSMQSIKTKEKSTLSYQEFNEGVFKDQGKAITESGLSQSRRGGIFAAKKKLNMGIQEFRRIIKASKYTEGDPILKEKVIKGTKTKTGSTGLSSLNRVEQLGVLQEMRHRLRVETLNKEFEAAGVENILSSQNYLDRLTPEFIKRSKYRIDKTSVGKLSISDMDNANAREFTLIGEGVQKLFNAGLLKQGVGKINLFGKTLYKGSRKEKNLKEKYEELGRKLENPKFKNDPEVKEYRKILDWMWETATKSGIDLGPRENFYFPKMFKKEYLQAFAKDLAKIGEIHPELVMNKNLQASKPFAKTVKNLIKKDFFDQKTVEALKAIASRSTVKDKDMAIASAISKLHRNVKSGFGSKNKNLEMARKADILFGKESPVFEKDARVVLTKYLNQWGKRVAFVEHFGNNGQVMLDRIGAINKKAKMLKKDGKIKESNVLKEQANSLKQVFMSLTNEIETDPAYNWTSARARRYWNEIVNFEVGTKIGLGFATIPNFTQMGVSTAVKAGYYPIIKAIYLLSRPTEEGRKYRSLVRQSGVTSLSIFEMLQGFAPTDSLLSKFADFTTTYSGFQKINRINQLVSAATAKEWIGLLQKTAKGEGLGRFEARRNWAQLNLQDLGITDFKNITERQKLEAMFKFARDSQLQRNVLEEPLAFNDPRFRPFFLFKKFGYKQTNWIKDNLTAEVKRGNLLPILRLGAAGMIGGELILWSKDKISELLSGQPVYDENNYLFPFLKEGTPMGADTEEDMSKFTMDDFLDRVSSVGAFGVITDIVANENRLRALEFAFMPAIIQDLDKVWDASQRTIEDMGEYGTLGSLQRLPKYLGPLLGTITRRGISRGETPGQKQTSITYRKGLTKSKILDALIDGDSNKASRLVNAWNKTYGEYVGVSRSGNPVYGAIFAEDISNKVITDRIINKARKRANP